MRGSNSVFRIGTVFFGLIASSAVAIAISGAYAASGPSRNPAIHKAPTWLPPHSKEVRSGAMAWLETVKASSEVKAKADAIWSHVTDQVSGNELLDRLAETFALTDARAAKLIELCSKPRSQAVLPTQAWLTDSKTSPFEANNMRLYFGRWLVQGQWFDEALEQLSGLKANDVAAPAALLFYQGVTYHRLLNKDEGLKAINQLLDGAEASPKRYVEVAYLMQSDLSALEPESLDHIARRMEDIQRRLDLGRAGPKVRKVEGGVIESLDKIIKKIEEEQNKQQQSNNGNSLRPTNPMKDSNPAAGKAPGDVTKKNIGSKSGWGDLGPKEREEAVQHIGREFPSHYRDIIEQYYRRLATEEGSEQK